MEPHLRTAVRWAAYPLLLVLTVGAGVTAIARGWNLQRTYGITIASLVLLLALLEALLPLRREWRMTGRSFLRDLKYLSAGALVIAGLNVAFGALALAMANHHGPLSAFPVAVQLPLLLLTFETVNYVQHRASHELGGRFGRFLWHSHAAHHLPDSVYVLMHAAFHPINALIVRVLATLLPMQVLGVSPETTLLFNLVVNFCGIISHTNLDLRAGWLNYVLVGPELHR